ncbi:MAG: tetratricopeptide repeat protein [Calditrichaeota bacterium]|nr:tetratricopeptide repeat protein [Calditrichota bacterium]
MFKTPWLSILIALIVRIIYWIQVSDQAWFQSPGTDPEFYLRWANAILTGHGNDFIPFPRGPLYAYILSGIQAVFGTWWIYPRLLNLLADLITTWLIFKLATRLGDRTTGLIASLLFAFSGAAVYFTGEVLMTSLATVLATSLLYSLLKVWEHPSFLFASLSGVFLALITLLRPNFILLIPLSLGILALSLYKAKTSNLKSSKVLLVHSLIILAIFSPVLIANWNSSGKLIPVASQGGVNFYIGNARGASGWASELPGAGAAWSEVDARRIASKHAGRSLNDPEASNQFWKMGLEEISADPVSWVKLLAKKSLLFLNSREIGNNRPLLLPVKSSTMIKLLMYNSMGALFPICLIGLMYSWKRPEIRIMSLYLMLFSFSILIFFTNTRYRIPILPVVLIIAAIGISHVVKSDRRNIFKWKFLSIFTFGCVIAMPNWSGSTFHQPAQAHYVHANALMRQGRTGEALKQFYLADNSDSDFPELHLNTGVALLANGDSLAALAAFQREVDSNPHSFKAFNNIGVVYEFQGKLRSAHDNYHEAVKINNLHSDGIHNLARIYLKMGDNFLNNGSLDSATVKYDLFSELLPSDPRSFHRLALVAIYKENWHEAKMLLEENLQLNPGHNQSRMLLSQLEMRRNHNLP